MKVALRLLGALVIGAMSAALTGEPLLRAIGAEAELPSPPAQSGTRVIVQLNDPPLALAGFSRLRTGGEAAPNSHGEPEYRASLERKQLEVAAAIERELPGAVIERIYRTAYNGLAVRLPAQDPRALQTLARLPDVASVSQERTYRPALYSSVPGMGVPAVWQQLGGVQNAGAGTKIAILDSGADVSHPMLDGSGMHYPVGYPRGDARATSPKVIVARAYFRPDDPPIAGEASASPGEAGSGHGTHLASIVAGRAVTATLQGLQQPVSGVAPQAWLLNYRLFYPAQSAVEEVAYTAEVLQAIDDAVADGADVLCLGWWSASPRLPLESPEADALEAAIAAGCVVVAAAGNQGPTYGSASGLPGGIEHLITVGAISKQQQVAHDLLDVVTPQPVAAQLIGQPFGRALFGPGIEQAMGPWPFVDVATLTPGNALACQSLPAGALTGKAALIDRGECHFADKAFLAQQAGAAAAIVINDSEELTAMGCGGDHCAPGAITIPTVLVRRSLGEQLRAWLSIYPAAMLRLDPAPRIADATPDIVQPYSARGPSFMYSLKPDVVAPGEAVLAAWHGDGAAAAYEQLSGTSQACAHVAGAAALLLQMHPTWTHDDVKSALMATARTAGARSSESSLPSAGTLDRGSGAVDLATAAQTSLRIDPPSLSLPRLSPGQTESRSLRLRDLRTGGATRVYTAAVTSEGMSVTLPSQIALAAGAVVTVGLVITLPVGAPEGDSYAEIRLGAAGQTVHLPVWARREPTPQPADILVIDNDFSAFDAIRDYAHFITAALDSLGVEYQVWDADVHFGAAQTLPDLTTLQQYRVILWFTGDNTHADGYYSVSTPLTALDLELLARYLEGGGRLLAMGQNLAEASDVNPDSDATWGRASLLYHYLGVHWLQGSLFAPTGTGSLPPAGQPALVGLPNTCFAGLSLDLGAVGDGAHDQVSVDEIAPGGSKDGSDRDLVQPLLMAVVGSPVESGYVAVGKAWDPSLEDERRDLPYRTLYMAFGLEGVNDVPALGSRAEALQAALGWLRDDVTVSLANVIGAPNEPVVVVCRPASSEEAVFQSFRWRLHGGPEERLFPSAAPTVTLMLTNSGTYSLSVEATDVLGHRAVAHASVQLIEGGSSSFSVDRDLAGWGQVIAYLVVARNTGSQAQTFAFTLPLPPGCAYRDHIGGTYAGGSLRWSGTLGPGESFGAELDVTVSSAAAPGSTIVAQTQFTVGAYTFFRRAYTAVEARLEVPLVRSS